MNKREEILARAAEETAKREVCSTPASFVVFDQRPPFLFLETLFGSLSELIFQNPTAPKRFDYRTQLSLEERLRLIETMET